MTPTPARLPLAHTPTPLEPLARLGRELGIELLVKRDDLTGSALTGNKVRKLEFLLADAVAQGADTVVTCGGEQSNHCRATAVAAARLGLGSRLLLRTADPSRPPPVEGNILLDKLVGAEIQYITPADYRRRKELFVTVAEELRARGRVPYIIPEGGSNALGAWGYVRAMEEMGRALQGATLIYAAGSGGTGAGLIAGARLLGIDVRIVGVNVCDDRAYFVSAIGDIVDEMRRAYGLGFDFDRERDVEIIDGYVGLGYAKSRPEELALIARVARAEGVILDPVYTGKAFFGMVSELAKDPRCFGERVVFLHTGGIFGLLAKSAELAPLL